MIAHQLQNTYLGNVHTKVLKMIIMFRSLSLLQFWFSYFAGWRPYLMLLGIFKLDTWERSLAKENVVVTVGLKTQHLLVASPLIEAK